MFHFYSGSGAPPAELKVSGVGNPYFFTGRRLHFLDTSTTSGGPQEQYSMTGGGVDTESAEPAIEGTTEPSSGLIEPSDDGEMQAMIGGGGGTTPTFNRQLQFNRARHYDPHHGRWLQRDPSGYVDGMNLYEYARSSPSVNADPTGHKTVSCVTQGFGGPVVFPPPHDWLPNYSQYNVEVRDIGGFQTFIDHWLSRKGTNLLFPAGSSYSSWLDATATVQQIRAEITDNVMKEAIGNAQTLLKCGEDRTTCITDDLKKQFLESPGGYFGTDWLSTGNITLLSYNVCNISKKCCFGGRNCTGVRARCQTRFVAHDSWHFPFPGKPFFWHAHLAQGSSNDLKYYGTGCRPSAK